MRSSRAMSLLQYLAPTAYMSLLAVVLLTIIFIGGCVKYNHKKGIKATGNFGIIMVFVGILILIIGYATSLDTLKYTHNSEKSVATVKKIEEKYWSEDIDYTYILEFPYGEQVITVSMDPSNKMPVKQGDLIEVYFYPEESDRERELIVVAVDIELQQAKKNIAIGCLSCIVGLSFLCLAKCRNKLIDNGIYTHATILRITYDSSRFNMKNNNEVLICRGKNPATGMIQTFQTKGNRHDFLSLSSGDVVYVFIHKKYPNFYLINI